MEVKRIICKSGREYNIVNEYWETSRAWGHKSTLIAPWGDIGSNKVTYLNRTWEYYRYQSCMSGLLNDILEKDLKDYITQYKEKNDITRLTSLQKDMIKAEWQEKEYTQELMEIKERINDRRFD